MAGAPADPELLKLYRTLARTLAHLPRGKAAGRVAIALLRRAYRGAHSVIGAIFAEYVGAEARPGILHPATAWLRDRRRARRHRRPQRC